MERLLSFLFRFKNFLLYLFLLIPCLVYFFLTSPEASSKLNEFTLNVIAPVHQSVNSITLYFKLRKINDSLIVENQQLNQFKFNQLHNQKMATINFIDKNLSPYDLKAANIIFASRSSDKNYFIVDKGSDDGIKPEMGVIHNRGVLGITRDVKSNYTRVISLLHRDLGLSVRVQPSGAIGILKWSHKTPTTMVISDIQKSSHIMINDIVETSGISTYYPDKIKIGKVSLIDSLSDPVYHRILVELFENPLSKKVAYLVSNTKISNIESLLKPLE